MGKVNYSFYVQVVPLNKVFNYGVPFRHTYFMDWEYDNLSDMLFMFDPVREILFFPDTVDVKTQKAAARILHRIINRPTTDSRGQETDIERLVEICSGEKCVWTAALYVFMHFYNKRHNYVDSCADLFAFHDRNHKKENRTYHCRKYEDFIKGNDVYYTYK